MEESVARYQGLQRYEQNQVPPPGNPQSNEAWALIQAARQIAAIIQYGDLSTPEDKKRLRDALRLNLRLWTIIQAEQLTGDNPLPDPIRGNILTLCNFIDRHTLLTLTEPTPERAAVLIDINRNIAAGLAGSTDDSQLPEEPAEAKTEQPEDDDAEKRSQPVEIDT
jgi:flagellar biosynthesis activator protein FlaF